MEKDQHWLLFQRARVQFSASTWWLMTGCYSAPRGPMSSSGLQRHRTHDIHIHSHYICIHVYKIEHKKNTEEFFNESIINLYMVAQTCNPCTLKAETEGWLRVEDRLELHKNTLSQNKNKIDGQTSKGPRQEAKAGGLWVQGSSFRPTSTIKN